ncbi:MAG: LysM peptidoglycan-binding domain-containing protein, partial [Nitrospiraceae bacterium]
AWRTMALCTLGFGMGIMMACSPLEPLDEPEVSDLQLTTDTLKASLRDAQRTNAELRAEVESRRQELADAQIARAQLEGRLREAERRLVEARHVIDLQREELAGSRSERERVAKSGAMLRSQMKQLQLQLSRIGKAAGDSRATGMASTASTPAARGRHAGAASARLEDAVSPEERAGGVGGVPGSKPALNNPVRVSVRPGDTLWSIGQRHRVSVKRLMAFNQLSDNHIQVGQALWLIAPPAAGEGEPPE